jgi:hypothetical protein
MVEAGFLAETRLLDDFFRVDGDSAPIVYCNGPSKTPQHHKIYMERR